MNSNMFFRSPNARTARLCWWAVQANGRWSSPTLTPTYRADELRELEVE